ncbi:MAG: anhydro-N-acetylmuramic acid kinase [Cellulomonadaceae bacterium]|jgi:anhydro-N-acetylmuramic acid kinase|nr:anhydro-N-acetylmuramic acid kinase [Cellulomonadaceae bacterium]
MMLAVGMMSGTSLDGIDVALVEFPDNKVEGLTYKLLDFETYPYPASTISRVQDAMSLERSNVALLCELNVELGKLYGQAALAMLEKHNLKANDLGFIANHGQTIYHAPNAKYPSTLQIGEPAEIYAQVKIPVVTNFREADVAAGGQGAPIVPFTEFQLYKSAEAERVFVNIGGIANITVLPRNASIDDIVAFDTGPGNMLIDAAMQHFYQKPYDENGDTAKTGNVNQQVLTELLKHSYFARPYPKTTGREDFGVQLFDELVQKYDLAPADWVATLTALTAKSLADAILQFPSNNVEVIIAGGGSYNATLLEMIRQYLPGVKIITQEEFGYSSEAKEAVAMAILGKYTLEGQPNNVPSATGASHPVVLGRITNR